MSLVKTVQLVVLSEFWLRGQSVRFHTSRSESSGNCTTTDTKFNCCKLNCLKRTTSSSVLLSVTRGRRDRVLSFRRSVSLLFFQNCINSSFTSTNNIASLLVHASRWPTKRFLSSIERRGILIIWLTLRSRSTVLKRRSRTVFSRRESAPIGHSS